MAWALGALVGVVASQAHAAALCSGLGHPVVVSGSSAVQPFLPALGARLFADHQIHLIYNNVGSCAGVSAVTAGSPGTVTGTANYYETATPVACDFDIAGNAVNIAVSDVFATSCPGVSTLADGVVDKFGPIQAITFAVPANSSALSISAEAAYLVYGFGAASNVVEPWSDPTQIIFRDASSGTQAMLAVAINVPGAKWKGVSLSTGSTGVISALKAAALANKQNNAIGILSASNVEATPELRALAYQHYGQTCGYLPDSTSAFRDKANVRDGHYQAWGPLHLLVRPSLDSAVNADVQLLVDELQTPSPIADPTNIIAIAASKALIPDCAMNVTRTTEIGPLMSYQPAKSCGCYYTSVAAPLATPAAECTTCTLNTDCPSARPACNYGFCEVQ